MAGSLLDPDALTHIDGGAHFATTDAHAAGTGGYQAAPLSLTALTAPTAVSFSLGQGGLELPAWPITGDGSSSGTGENVGPIGRYVRGDGSDQTVVLTDADDTFVGSDGNEHVLGLGGDDRLDGAGGDDWLEGGPGQDTLLGGSGDDLLQGGSGDDALDGGSGNDRLEGGSGRDQLAGGSGDDYLDGGPGTDLLAGGTGHDVLVLADIRDAATELPLGADSGGNDTVVVTDGYGSSLASALPATGGKATFVLGRPDLASFPHDVAAFHQQIDPDIENIRLEGSGAHDVVGDDRDSVIIGNASANHLYGGGGADNIDGGAGGDWIYGGAGDDWILGGDGNDWIDGGDGADTLYGGAGDDTFVLGLHEGQDRVFDHEGHNALFLKGGADAGSLTAELQGNDLVLSHADQVIATLQDYAHHADSFTGIDLGQGLRPLDDFITHEPEPALARADSADWLADFLPAPADNMQTALAEPWSTMVDQPTTGPVPGAAAAETDAVIGHATDAGTVDPLVATAHLPTLGDPMAGADLWLPIDPEPGPAFDDAGASSAHEAADPPSDQPRHATG